MKVTVYYFKDWAPSLGEVLVSKRAATLKALRRIPSAEPLMDTGFEIDDSELDGDGFVRKTD
jgi:hypothetical protein